MQQTKRYLVVVLTVTALFFAVGCQEQPLKNPEGTSAGLASTPTESYPQGRAMIVTVTVASVGTSNGYTRSQFGSPWLDQVSVPFGYNSCDARNDILKRDMTDKTFDPAKPDCTVKTGKLSDPYTKKKIDFVRGTGTSNAVQIDHVIPLSYAWKMGAQGWTYEKRKNFANDPINLLAVDGPVNASKGDKGPAAWMPPNTAITCSYSIRFAQVSKKYTLPVTQADKSKMLSSCS